MIDRSEIMYIIKRHKDFTDVKDRLSVYKRVNKAKTKEEKMKILKEFSELSLKNRVQKPQ